MRHKKSRAGQQVPRAASIDSACAHAMARSWSLCQRRVRAHAPSPRSDLLCLNQALTALLGPCVQTPRNSVHGRLCHIAFFSFCLRHQVVATACELAFLACRGGLATVTYARLYCNNIEYAVVLLCVFIPNTSGSQAARCSRRRRAMWDDCGCVQNSELARRWPHGSVFAVCMRTVDVFFSTPSAQEDFPKRKQNHVAMRVLHQHLSCSARRPCQGLQRSVAIQALPTHTFGSSQQSIKRKKV